MTEKTLQTSAAATRDALDALTVDDLRRLCAARGYVLRKKGVKRDKRKEEDEEGNVIRNTYAPHIAVTASCYARTWKLYRAALEVWGSAEATVGDVWEKRLLLACEHIVRFIKREIDDTEMSAAIRRLINPLRKEEYIKRGKTK